MWASIRARLSTIENRIRAALPLWPDDSDGFLAALGVDCEKYRVKNPDGSAGFDALRALSDTAASDWRE